MKTHLIKENWSKKLLPLAFPTPIEKQWSNINNEGGKKKERKGKKLIWKKNLCIYITWSWLSKKLQTSLLPHLHKKRGGNTNLKRNQRGFKLHNKEVTKNTTRSNKYLITNEVRKPWTHSGEVLENTLNTQGGIEDYQGVQMRSNEPTMLL